MSEYNPSYLPSITYRVILGDEGRARQISELKADIEQELQVWMECDSRGIGCQNVGINPNQGVIGFF